MSNKHIHIVSFDIPYPPNYGGIIDVFYKIKALKSLGVDITLHCFLYNDKKANDELNKFCKQIYYYKRDTSVKKQFHILPYSVISRKNNDLLNNLLKDHDPILFEGLMSCYYLDNSKLKDRLKLFREANIEHDYYCQLSRSTHNLKKKTYFLIESFKFRIFEKKLSSADILYPISQTDELYFSKKFNTKKVEFVPCFHSNEKITSKEGLSNYVLYHGNLSVAENEKAATYLCENIFNKLNVDCVISGMNPTDSLIKTAAKYKNIRLIPNPGFNTMHNLIENAQVNILVTFQSTGMKIKLLNTLFSGKHIVVNNAMIKGTGLEDLCYVANDTEKQIETCNKLIKLPFTKQDILTREKFLYPQYDNIEQAKKIVPNL